MLERGAKKTKEMQEKLDVADKGDMLDFKIDDNSGVQVRCLCLFSIRDAFTIYMWKPWEPFVVHSFHNAAQRCSALFKVALTWSDS